MKYLIQTIVPNEVSPHLDEVQEGWDRLSHTPIWAELNDFKTFAIESGGLDRYWGPFDSVVPVSDILKKITICYNTLECANAWFDITVDGDNKIINEQCKHVKLVEIDDTGTEVQTIKESEDLTV